MQFFKELCPVLKWIFPVSSYCSQAWHPHTVLLFSVLFLFLSLPNDKERVIIATASPAKFTEAVIAAGLTPQKDERVVGLENKETKYEDMEKGQDWEKILRMKIMKVSESEG